MDTGRNTSYEYLYQQAQPFNPACPHSITPWGSASAHLQYIESLEAAAVWYSNRDGWNWYKPRTSAYTKGSVLFRGIDEHFQQQKKRSKC